MEEVKEEARYTILNAMQMMKQGHTMWCFEKKNDPYQISIKKVEGVDRWVFVEKRAFGEFVENSVSLSADGVMGKDVYFTMKK